MAGRRATHPELRIVSTRSLHAASETTRGFYLGASSFGGYRVERILSTGSLGAVVSARHLARDQAVVIKLLHPDLCHDPVSIARMSREAHVLAHIASERVVRLLDTGWTAEVGPYVVLEHLVGMDLQRMLETNGRLPLVLAVDYVLQACEGLAVAHASGITHRDVKPENLFAVRGGSAPQLKLLDFGIAQHGPESFPYREIAAQSAEGPLLGTPAYMSPERIQELPTDDQRSDIWSLGVVLHELVTGRTLFGRADQAETCERVLSHTFELETDRELLPPPLRAVIARCLARRPADRYQSVEELAAALRRNVALPERWRGTLTGKFSRQVLSEEASSPSAALPPAVPASRASLHAPRGGVWAALAPYAGVASGVLSGAPSLETLAAWLRARWGFGAWLAIALAAAALAGSLVAGLEQSTSGSPVPSETTGAR